jgi:pyruvate dehydrogenase E1 component alpha subunit
MEQTGESTRCGQLRTKPKRTRLSRIAIALHGVRLQSHQPMKKPATLTIPSTGQDATGATVARAEKNGFSLISDGKLLGLYTAMVKCRMIAERVELLRRQGSAGEDFAAGVGREAAMAGVVADLLPGDTLSLSRGSLVAGFVKGMPPEKLFASLGKTGNGWHSAVEQSGNGGGAGIPAQTADEQIRAARNAALANKTAGNGKVAVVFCADWQDEAGAWCKALSYAGTNELPILFVIHEDAHAERESGGVQGEAPNFAMEPLALGVPAITVDGNDVVAVYRVAFEALARARQGRGGTLIECVVTRFQSTSGMNGDETEQRNAHDPILKMQAYLERKQLFNAEEAQRVVAEFSRELDVAAGRWTN